MEKYVKPVMEIDDVEAISTFVIDPDAGSTSGRVSSAGSGNPWNDAW